MQVGFELYFNGLVSPYFGICFTINLAAKYLQLEIILL